MFRFIKKTLKFFFVTPYAFLFKKIREDFRELKNGLNKTKRKYKTNYIDAKRELKNEIDNIPLIKKMEKDFKLTCKVWGISPTTRGLSLAQKYYQKELFSFILILCFGILILTFNFFIQGLLLITLGIMGCLSRFWKIKVLKQKRFVPFLKWLTGR